MVLRHKTLGDDLLCNVTHTHIDIQLVVCLLLLQDSLHKSSFPIYTFWGATAHHSMKILVNFCNKILPIQLNINIKEMFYLINQNLKWGLI